MGRYVIGALAGLVLAIALAFAVSVGGWANVGAVWRDPPPLTWWLRTTYEKSVARQAADIGEPVDLDDSALVLAGARAFDEICSICHTPPGRSPTVQSQGLNPPPPDLSQLLDERTPAQAFWVIRNGVRMTGMPAFGPTHPDAHLWQLVAFLKRARGMDAVEYREIMTAARKMPAGDGHSHRHGSGMEPDQNRVIDTMPASKGGRAGQSGPADPAERTAPTAPAGGYPHQNGDHHEH